jgi:hypothetical protein
LGSAASIKPETTTEALNLLGLVFHFRMMESKEDGIIKPLIHFD